MREHISLLRGINVGGKVLPMKGLVAMYESLGLEDVRSYIQSGNVLFNAPGRDTVQVRVSLESRIRELFGLEVTVIMRTHTELQGVLETNPFVRSGIPATAPLYVGFLAAEPESHRIRSLPRDARIADQFRVIGRHVFLHCPGGYGKTPYSNSYFEKYLEVAATTRNWNTVNRLRELAES